VQSTPVSIGHEIEDALELRAQSLPVAIRIVGRSIEIEIELIQGRFHIHFTSYRRRDLTREASMKASRT
jgi:hypothetical protein